MDHPQEFLRICRKNGLRVDPGQFDQLRQYVDLLTAWNSKINLISRRDIENVWFSHILHSLAPCSATFGPGNSRHRFGWGAPRDSSGYPADRSEYYASGFDTEKNQSADGHLF